jgi:N-acyl-L-homoserine lactone synthetase
MQTRQSQAPAERIAASTQRDAELSAFSKRVSLRIAKRSHEREAIFKLRYQAFLRSGMIVANSFERYVEPADHAPDTYLVGVHIDSKLVGSLRLSKNTLASPGFPAIDVFPELVRPLLENNKSIVEMSCVATHGDLARLNPRTPYAIIRAWIVAAEHFGADYIVTTARPQHQLFYQRTLGCEVYPDQRQLPYHLSSAGLVTLNFSAAAERLYRTFPYLRSTSSESAQLFDFTAVSARADAFDANHKAPSGNHFPD